MTRNVRNGAPNTALPYSVLIVSQDAQMVAAAREAFEAGCATAATWTAVEHPAEVTVVDLRDVLLWDDLEAWSRSQRRSSLILIDDASVERDRLVRLNAEALVTPEEGPAALTAAIEMHSRLCIFRAAAATVTTCADLPYPLSRFIAAAFMTGQARVTHIANLYSLRPSTLRNQWRRLRSDPALRLEDVVRQIAQLHALAPAASLDVVRSEVNHIMQAIGASKFDL